MGKKKLFILDDEEDIVRPLAARFESEGLEVGWAFEPEGGIAKLKVFKPDVVLLDVIMPKMDGWEVCRRLRADPQTKDLSLIVMTAIMSKELVSKAFAAKVQVITKPLSEREIAKVIETSERGGTPPPKPSGPASA